LFDFIVGRILIILESEPLTSYPAARKRIDFARIWVNSRKYVGGSGALRTPDLRKQRGLNYLFIYSGEGTPYSPNEKRTQSV